MSDLNINLTIKAPEAEALIKLLRDCFAAGAATGDNGAAATEAEPEANEKLFERLKADDPVAPRPRYEDPEPAAADPAPAAPQAKPNDGAAIAPEDQPDAGMEVSDETPPTPVEFNELMGACSLAFVHAPVKPEDSAAFIKDCLKPFGVDSMKALKRSQYKAYEQRVRDELKALAERHHG